MRRLSVSSTNGNSQVVVVEAKRIQWDYIDGEHICCDPIVGRGAIVEEANLYHLTLEFNSTEYTLSKNSLSEVIEKANELKEEFLLSHLNIQLGAESWISTPSSKPKCPGCNKIPHLMGSPPHQIWKCGCKFD